jgi:hypothetical protein
VARLIQRGEHPELPSVRIRIPTELLRTAAGTAGR